MHVTRLRISGVRSFHGPRSVDLDLTRPDGSLAGWTVLASRNGSGKSTILQSLALALAGSRATSFIPSIADWMSRGTETAQIRTELSLSDSDGHEFMLLPLVVEIAFDRSAPEECLKPVDVPGSGCTFPDHP